MVKKIRKPLALFLALVMCLSMVNFTALASETADHEHNADGWTCTQAEPVKTLNCEEDHEHGDDCYTVTEGAWTCVAPVVEETPAEVTTFLSAVAGIPAITAENAAEVAEYVYGPVSEAYEALLSTGYEERADVLEATAAYAAAIDAVDAALDMYSSELASGYIPVENVGIYPDKKPTGNTATGKVRYSNQSLTMKVGQRASFLLGAPTNELYHLNSWGYKHTIAVYNPSDYCDISLIDNSGNNIVGNPTYAAGDNQGTRVFDTVFEALKPGVSNDVRVCYYTNFGIVFANGADFAYIPCPVCGASKLVYKDVTWYRYNDVFGITVNADYVLNLDPNGGTVSPTSERKTVASTSCTFSLPIPTHPEGKTFLGWSDGTNTYTGSYTLNWSEGYGSEANPVTGSLTAVWEDAETYTVTYTDGVTGETVFADQGYEGLKVGDATPGFEGGTPTRENYTFMGWAPAVKSKVAAADANTNGEIIYTATWKKNEIPTTYTIVHEYYTNNTKDGETKQENVSGKNVGDTVKVADITKNLTYKKGNETYTYTYTRANKGVVADNPYGYSLGAVITELTLAESGNIIVLRYDRTTTPPVTNPKLEKLEKERLTAAPAGVTLELGGKTVNYDQNVVFVGDNAPAVTLLYKITVTGTAGAKYKVTDTGATHVGGDPLVGTIAEGKTQAVIYVTMDFTKANITADGKLVNNATLESNDPVTPEKPGGTEGPTNGGATGEAGAKKQYNVTINFKTEGGAVLKDPSKTTVDEGADFNYSLASANARKARANSDVTAVVIPQRLGTNNEYVLDMVASAAGLDKLTKAKNITADVVADIIYSLDEKGTTGTDSEGNPTDTFDGIPDKYQVKVTFKVVHGKWNDETNADVVKYVVKYAEDGETMDANGEATLGSIIPAVGEKPDQGYEAGSWNTEPKADTTVTDETTYTYTYNKTVVIIPEYKVTVDPANGENKTETTVKENSEFTVPAAPTAPEGKAFDGWKGSDGKDYKPGDEIIVTGNLTLTAQWVDVYTVTYDLNGGSSNAQLEYKGLRSGAATPTIANPTRDGYTFNGWTPAVSATVTGSVTYVAQWTLNTRPVEPDPDYTYTLNYNANGGVGAPASQSQTNDRNFTVSAVEPTREGYTFAGWATAANAEEAAYQPGSQIRINTGYSLTLHAVWTPVEDVDETEPPLVETPETTEPTETPDEGEDLGDNDTPLTELPETSEPPVEPTETPEAQEPDESEDLGDNDTPLAEVPQTGDALGLWIVLALCSAAGLAWIALTEKKGKRVA